MTISDMDSTRGWDGYDPASVVPEVGDEIEMRAPFGPGWVRAIVTHVSIVPTRDAGDIAIVAASGTGPGPHVTSFWPGEHFRRRPA